MEYLQVEQRPARERSAQIQLTTLQTSPEPTPATEYY